MNESISGAEELDSETKKMLRRECKGKDLQLTQLLGLVFGTKEVHHEGRIGLTVSVSGTVISGNAISHARWVELFSEQITSAGAPDTATVVSKVYAIQEEKRQDLLAKREEDGLPFPPYGYLHFEDARILNGGTGFGPFFFHSGLTRVRLDRVDAWSLGIASSNEES